MIQSLPLLSQVGGRTRLFMEQEPADYDPAHGHGPALPTLSSQNFMPGFPSERGNIIIEYGGPSSFCRAGLAFYNTREKAEVGSVDREALIIGAAEIPIGRHGSPARNWLSMANGLDETADRGGNSEECAQSSPAFFQPELSMRSSPSDEKSVAPTGSQQSAESAPNAYNASPTYDGNRSRQDDRCGAHNFPASCADGAEIGRRTETNNPALLAVQRGTAREPWIHRSYGSEESRKPWTPLKKMARKNNMTALAACKNSMEANNSGHMVGSRNGAAARACVDCYTTKTPLWRSGPRGPKSLCNACGIRYRKTRRAALSECIDGNAMMGSPKRKTQENSIHFKKRSRLPMASCKKNIGFENRSAFPRVFAQEEEEAAVLLMALSCGLVHG